MKKFFLSFICILIILLVAINTESISSYIASFIGNPEPINDKGTNGYTKQDNFLYVKKNESMIPYSFNDLKNVLYTAINNGWDNFSFYCPSEYTECVNDMTNIINDSLIVTNINNYVHPYNSFADLSSTIYDSGEINITINHIYSKEEINTINSLVDQIILENYDKNKSEYDNIKKIHDYIINNTKYDQTRNEDGNSQYKSNTAYGTLVDHLATCNGYTDTMAIILSKLNIKNYKIATTPDRISYASTGHIWNAVYLDNKWYHLDLTWDDPVSDNGQDYLLHKYFLVSSEELAKADSGNVVIEEHNFDSTIYLEFNEAINSLT